MDALRDGFIVKLDSLDGDPDLEPSLALTDGLVALMPSGGDDRELEELEGALGWSEAQSTRGRLTAQSFDDEPSLSALEQIDQRRWARGGEDGHVHRDWDCEEQSEDEGAHDEDREPWLGAQETGAGTRWNQHNQGVLDGEEDAGDAPEAVNEDGPGPGFSEVQRGFMAAIRPRYAAPAYGHRP